MAAIVIQPTRGWRRLRLRELWESRELLWFLVWRDVKVRYKQTAFGVAWAVLQPLVMMVIFTVFLGHLAKIGTGRVPYPLFVYSGLVPWIFFSQALSTTSQSLVANQALVAKIYFPRLLLPLASIGSYLMDLGISFLLLIVLMAHYGVHVSARLAVLPAFVLLGILTLFAVGILFASLNVRYRDVKYAVTAMLQAWLFLSPVVYPASLIPSPLRAVYGLNPMVGVIEGFRWTLLGTSPPGAMVAVSAAVTLLLLVGSLWYFVKTERGFADVI